MSNDNQVKKDFLRQYRKGTLQIDSKIEELTHWQARAEKITPTISAEPKGASGSDRIQTAVEHIIEIEDAINVSIEELMQTRDQVKRAIATVPDTNLQVLLELRYIGGMTWEQIAVKLNYNYRWVLRLHGRALDQLAIVSHYDPGVLLS